MKKSACLTVLILWVLVATIALGSLWLVRPELGPQLPPALSLRLIKLYGSSDGEELRDLETLVALACALPLVLVVTAAGALVWRWHRKLRRS